MLKVITDDRPRVSDKERISVERLSPDFWRVALRFGFMETPNVAQALARARACAFKVDVRQASFFLSRRALRPAPRSEMPRWQDRFFIGLAASANDASQYFGIPSGRAVEMGAQVAV